MFCSREAGRARIEAEDLHGRQETGLILRYVPSQWALQRTRYLTRSLQIQIARAGANAEVPGGRAGHKRPRRERGIRGVCARKTFACRTQTLRMQLRAAVHADTFSWSDGVPGVPACDFRVRARPGASLRVRPSRARVFRVSAARLVYITARGATTRFLSL